MLVEGPFTPPETVIEIRGQMAIRKAVQTDSLPFARICTERCPRPAVSFVGSVFLFSDLFMRYGNVGVPVR